MSSKYVVKFDEYTERHFIKNFKKKYSDKVWRFTENAIRPLCSNFEQTVQLDQCDTISHHDNLRLCKLDFAVAGTGKSPKSSGNRIILVADVEVKTVDILLVYHKKDMLKSRNETAAWKKIIKKNFPEYTNLLH